MEIISYSHYSDNVARAHEKIDTESLNSFIQLLDCAFLSEQTVFIFGNGGSGATASHFCEDLGKGTLFDVNSPVRLRVMSLTDNSPYILAWANDCGYETIFEQQLKNFAKPDDIAIAISGSGNSKNLIRAIEYANTIDMTTVGFTGYDGGKLRRLTDYQIHIPCTDMGIVESVHLSVMHYIVMVLSKRFKSKIISNQPKSNGYQIAGIKYPTTSFVESTSQR